MLRLKKQLLPQKMKNNFVARRQKCSSALFQAHSNKADTTLFLLTQPFFIQYFTGFTTLVPEEREAYVLITNQKWYLFHAAFSPTSGVSFDDDLVLKTGSHPKGLKSHLYNVGQELDTTFTSIGIDKTSTTVEELELINEIMPQAAVTSLDTQLLWSIRMVKDDLEQKQLTQAGQIAAQAFEKVITQLKPGITELAVAQLLERTMQQLGATEPAFPTIVAFGEHGALPHYQPGTTSLETETPILIDFGATFNGYRSDMTRSFWFGENPSQKFQEIEQLVVSAYDAAIKTLPQAKSITEEPPKLLRDSSKETSTNYPTAKQVDAAARQTIADAGYGKAFIHTTGHGVGLDIHEPPSLGWASEQTLQPGMAITIEPGIYLENEFGYRHENTCLVQ